MSQAPAIPFRGNHRTTNLMTVDRLTGELIRDRFHRPVTWPRSRSATRPFRAARCRSVWVYPGTDDLIIELQRPQEDEGGNAFYAADRYVHWYSKRNITLAGIPPGTPLLGGNLDFGSNLTFGEHPADGHTVLVKHQTDTTQNGIWVVRPGAWDRLSPPLPIGTLIGTLIGHRPPGVLFEIFKVTQRYPLTVTAFAGWTNHVIARVDQCGCVKWERHFAPVLPAAQTKLTVTDGGRIVLRGNGNGFSQLSPTTGQTILGAFGPAFPSPELAKVFPIPSTDEVFLHVKLPMFYPSYGVAFDGFLYRCYADSLATIFGRPYFLAFVDFINPAKTGEPACVCGDSLISQEWIWPTGIGPKLHVLTKRSGGATTVPTSYVGVDSAILNWVEFSPTLRGGAATATRIAIAADEGVFLFDASLNLLWHAPVGLSTVAAVAVDETGVYVLADNLITGDHTDLFKLDLTTGALLWSRGYGFRINGSAGSCLHLCGDTLIVSGDEVTT